MLNGAQMKSFCVNNEITCSNIQNICEIKYFGIILTHGSETTHGSEAFWEQNLNPRYAKHTVARPTVARPGCISKFKIPLLIRQG